MTFLLDHDVPDDITYSLRTLGHRVTLLRAALAKEATDQEVFSFAAGQRAVLITCNRDDFLDLAKSQPHHGIIILIRRKSRVRNLYFQIWSLGFFWDLGFGIWDLEWLGVRTSDFDFELPEQLIAQHPLPKRDASRLLVLDRATQKVTHQLFPDLLEYLRAGDVLILNNSRVIPARLRGTNVQTGGEFEILLLEEKQSNDWWCMLRPGKRARVGTEIQLDSPKGSVPHSYFPPRAVVVEINDEGHRRLRFQFGDDIKDKLDELGEMPLPPYIRRDSADERAADRNRYQTVFAQTAGSVAAPTAGLHFTDCLLDRIRSLGVEVCFVTLHVGLGTFAPVKKEILSHHQMHEERFEVPKETALAVNEAKRSGRRVIAVGTTTLRVLESLAASAAVLSEHRNARVSERGSVGASERESVEVSHASTLSHSTDTPIPSTSASLPPTRQRSHAPHIPAGPGRTNIFIYPPYDFKVVDVLLTNFHLPRSTLLMLASAFAAPNQTRGRDLILSAYSEAIAEGYRFFSYGDAMLIV